MHPVDLVGRGASSMPIERTVCAGCEAYEDGEKCPLATLPLPRLHWLVSNFDGGEPGPADVAEWSTLLQHVLRGAAARGVLLTSGAALRRLSQAPKGPPPSVLGFTRVLRALTAKSLSAAAAPGCSDLFLRASVTTDPVSTVAIGNSLAAATAAITASAAFTLPVQLLRGAWASALGAVHTGMVALGLETEHEASLAVKAAASGADAQAQSSATASAFIEDSGEAPLLYLPAARAVAAALVAQVHRLSTVGALHVVVLLERTPPAVVEAAALVASSLTAPSGAGAPAVLPDASRLLDAEQRPVSLEQVLAAASLQACAADVYAYVIPLMMASGTGNKCRVWLLPPDEDRLGAAVAFGFGEAGNDAETSAASAANARVFVRLRAHFAALVVETARLEASIAAAQQSASAAQRAAGPGAAPAPAARVSLARARAARSRLVAVTAMAERTARLLDAADECLNARESLDVLAAGTAAITELRDSLNLHPETVRQALDNARDAVEDAAAVDEALQEGMGAGSAPVDSAADAALLAELDALVLEAGALDATSTAAAVPTLVEPQAQPQPTYLPQAQTAASPQSQQQSRLQAAATPVALC